MSRAVQEDLSHLSFGARLNVKAKNFLKWAHNKEEGTWLGERRGIQWGQLLLYYLVFYTFLAAFTTVFFAILGYLIPDNPNEILEGICSREGNAIDFCGSGPTFQARHLYHSGKTSGIYTDSILEVSLCEPALVSIPRTLNIGSDEPDSGTNFDDSRAGYNSFFNELDRVFCRGKFIGTANPVCNSSGIQENGSSDENNILPVLYKDENTLFAFDDYKSMTKDNLINDKKPKPYYSIINGSDTFDVYYVFLRFNKVWNYVPYASTKTGSEREKIQNSIGLSCSLNKETRCTGTTTKGIDAQGQDVTDCERLSKDGIITIQALSNVMTNSGGFPWVGGALNMNFGALAVIHKKDAAIPKGAEITCKMGVKITDGTSFFGAGLTTSTEAIGNFQKQGPLRAYSQSNGDEITIPLK